MSKEIYKEYFNDWINAVGEEEQAEVNRNYIWGGRTIAEHNEMTSSDEDCFLGLVVNNLLELKRKPKTQMINGHEVVAPRYDSNLSDYAVFYILDSGEESMVRAVNYVSDVFHINNIIKNGWFDNKEHALAYANAHRENKNE